MDGREFFERVSRHPDLEWLGVVESGGAAEGRPTSTSSTEDRVLVGNVKTHLTYAVPLRTLLEADWQDIEGVLVGRRQARVMTHLTRIVGYFSQTRNWNRSKLAELRDRRAGQYAIPEPGRAAPAERVPVRAEAAA